jgi:thiosulfate reductase cytochrome b subunit
MSLPQRSTPAGDVLVYRHPLLVRSAHWLSALCMFVLMLSGLQILNAHPAFYWGDTSTFDQPWAAIVSSQDENAEVLGRLQIGALQLDTTGFLGASTSGEGPLQARAMPSWLTQPSYLDLGAGRAWHFFFAWIFVLVGLAYLLHGAITGRLRSMLVPSAVELRSLGQSIIQHVRFAHRQQSSPTYNVLQKLAYLAVLGVFAPLMVLTGLAMSPAIDAAIPLIADVFGGRQSARTIHFIVMLCLIMFVVVHLAMVIIAGPLRELRTIITGWYLLKRKSQA